MRTVTRRSLLVGGIGTAAVLASVSKASKIGPFFTIFAQYDKGTTDALTPDLVVKNGKVFKELIQNYNVKAVFQGHTHVVEECAYLGTRYITGGAVCGDWWKGPRFGVHPEGFVVANVTGEELSWRYVSYGWKARPAPTLP